MKKVMVGFIGLLLGISVQAAETRYLVKVKSPAMFNNIVMQMRHQSPAFFSNPQVSNFRLFAQTACKAELLENVGMLVVETADGVADLQNNPEIEFVEQEVLHPLPKFPMGQIAGHIGAADTMPRPWGIDAVKAPQAWANS